MILDLFAGPGGWSQGLRSLGLDEIGLENDQIAVATRTAAGHQTNLCDIAQESTSVYSGIEGIIASPPCTDFSNAGKKQDLAGRTGNLIFEIDRWVTDLRPRFVLCEQVPRALQWFEVFAAKFDEMGYFSWTGVLNCADFGIPQMRKRAFLMASLDSKVFPPIPTHPSPHWVSMASALSWERPVLSNPYPYEVNDQTGTAFDWDWPFTRPATTVAGRGLIGHPGANANRFNGKTKSRNDGIKISLREALLLQTFPGDYPVAGTVKQQFLQVGNAVPPKMASKLISHILSLGMQ